MITILEELKRRKKNNIESELYGLIDKVTKGAQEHLKLVVKQLPNFDIHDKTHSMKVIENIEGLLKEEVIKRLSSYDLFFLYMAGYLHDCAMALPAWEENLLKMTEGKEGFIRTDIPISIAHDGEVPFRQSEALEFIQKNKKYIYDNFEKCKPFIFSFQNEHDFINDLAKRLIDYQSFRNRFSDELKALFEKGSIADYIKSSDLIRYDFIRSTHAKRVETYILNLSDKFTEYLGGAWGKAIAEDLAKICRAHGEPKNYLDSLNINASYFGEETSNLRFAAIMLRLGDILHFSFDRAPESLFAEKMISVEDSLIHWKAKFQGLNYSLDEIDSDGRIKIKFMAYCNEPSTYYFIDSYLDWIDDEITIYFGFWYGLDYSRETKPLVERYGLNIPKQVDRQIRYDEEKFTPQKDLKFTLNQEKILELLMGVGLYKNRFLCLRELYQNSLDACRCMISIMEHKGMEARGKIEFGLEKYFEDGQEKQYLYCLDNGNGMTKSRVINYLLKIGNSFYNSREFQQMNSGWNKHFKPVSQFGIGILSCFMIGDRIEVTTKALTEDGKNGESISFSIDGLHENFYFKKPEGIDAERINYCGTLVKIYLSKDVEITDAYLGQPFESIIYGVYNSVIYKEKFRNMLDEWKVHIYNLIYIFIGESNNNIDIGVKMEDGKLLSLIPRLSIIDLSKFDDEIVERILKKNNIDINLAAYLKEIEPFIKRYIIVTETEDIRFSILINLPLPGIKLDRNYLSFIPCLSFKRSFFLVDGIGINRNNVSSILRKIDKFDGAIINFIGFTRPDLSVDRDRIISLPQQLIDQLESLPKKIASSIFRTVKDHFNTYIGLSTEEKEIMWDYIFYNFSNLNPYLINYIAEDGSLDIPIQYLSKENRTFKQLIQSNEVSFTNLDIRLIKPTEKLILVGKLFKSSKIEVIDERITIYSELKGPLLQEDIWFSEGFDYKSFIFMADAWQGKYKDYDIVTNMIPIVPKKTFNKIHVTFSTSIDYKINEFSKKIIFVDNSRSSLSGMSSIDPVFVHPKLGIYTYEGIDNTIYKFDEKINFLLSELNDDGRMVFEDKKDFFLYVFIPPRLLNEKESNLIIDYKEEDEKYYEGVLNGWSVLFLGNTGVTIIEPGIVSRAEMIKKIKPSFWEMYKEITYNFLDDTDVRTLL